MTTPLRNKTFGASMIELLVGLAIFSFAMMPVMFLSSAQNKNTYSASKHLMANQLASSFLDEITRCSYNKTEKLLKTYTDKQKNILDHPNFKRALASIENADVKSEIETSFKHFKYQYIYDIDENNKIAQISIAIFYRLVEGDEKTYRKVTVSALKHGDLQ
jgi:Tfp pilus assembly protein PilV